jgi:mRNA-degrading endonuclease RelE of RelBE toxin-antitoxin system
MAWRIDFDPAAQRELDKLDNPTRRRITKFLYERVGNSTIQEKSDNVSKGRSANSGNIELETTA